jgi:argininosuccinate lyase
VRSVLTVQGSIASRDAYGGTAPVRVAEQLGRLVDRAVTARGFSAGRAR